jgi:hypothetical protein
MGKSSYIALAHLLLIEKALVIADDLIKNTGHKFLDLIDHLLRPPAEQDTTKNSKGKIDSDIEKNTTTEDILNGVCNREGIDAVVSQV